MDIVLQSVAWEVMVPEKLTADAFVREVCAEIKGIAKGTNPYRYGLTGPISA
jgi:hypothetical protein